MEGPYYSGSVISRIPLHVFTHWFHSVFCENLASQCPSPRWRRLRTAGQRHRKQTEVSGMKLVPATKTGNPQIKEKRKSRKQKGRAFTCRSEVTTSLVNAGRCGPWLQHRTRSHRRSPVS
ncbi:unnamed protein product [Lota lota]